MNKSLLIVVGAIILINLIAILLLSQKEKELEQKFVFEENSPSKDVVKEENKVLRNKPVVETVILQDKQQCPDCFDIEIYIEPLTDVMNLTTKKEKPGVFKLKYYPALAFNSTIEDYPELIEGWGESEIIEIEEGRYQGKWYILPSLNAPYYDLETGETLGKVKVTYLTYESCEECYDVEELRPILENQKVFVDEEYVFDVESIEGSTIVRKYNITRYPTFILDSQAQYYRGLVTGWEVMGTMAYDGSYILRNLDRLKVVYYDAEFDKVMIP